MTAITFPSSPTLGQYYTSDTKTWQWDGERWMPAGVIISGTLTSNSVGTASIQDNAVTTAKIADSGITTAKIAANISVANITLTGTSTLGAVGNIKVTGGSSGQVITTDGTGNLSFASIPTPTSLGAVTVSGAATFSGLVTVTQSAEVLVTKTGATGVVAHDLTTATTFYHSSPAANFTANFTNVSTTDSRVLVAALVIIQSSTPYVPTAVQIDGTAQTIKWMSSTSPSGTASKTDIVSFSFIRTGAAWTVLGQYSNYG